MEYYLGFDIGGTKCAVSLAEIADGKLPRILQKKSVDTDFSENAETFVGRLADIGTGILEKSAIPQSQIAAVGISCGGFIDAKNGIVVTTPVIPSWRNVEIVKIVESKIKARAFVQNDANACALVEWIFGAGRGAKHMVFLTCGTGLGAGLIVNGALLEGANGNAGEVGHIRLENWGPVACGKSGSLESFASGYGIGQLGKIKAAEILHSGGECTFCSDMSKLETVTAKTLAEAAANGDETAAEIFAIAGDFLGRGIAVICDILNPELVVIGSVFKRSEKLMRPFLEKAFARESQAFTRQCCRIVAAELGENVGDYAALSIAVNGLKNLNKK